MATNNYPPFQPIKQAVASTGFSAHFLRNGIKAGRVPYVKVGAKYLVNVPLLLEQMNIKSGSGEMNEQK